MSVNFAKNISAWTLLLTRAVLDSVLAACASSVMSMCARPLSMMLRAPCSCLQGRASSGYAGDAWGPTRDSLRRAGQHAACDYMFIERLQDEIDGVNADVLVIVLQSVILRLMMRVVMVVRADGCNDLYLTAGSSDRCAQVLGRICAADADFQISFKCHIPPE